MDSVWPEVPEDPGRRVANQPLPHLHEAIFLSLPGEPRFLKGNKRTHVLCDNKSYRLVLVQKSLGYSLAFYCIATYGKF